MLSISGAMSPGQGLTAYFTGTEDYYLSSPGRWQGQGAAALGLAGVVTREQFRLVSNGYHPISGQQLVPGKEIDGKIKKQAGNDLTFSADKSISIAAIVDPQIKVLHERAVAKVIDFVEQNNMQARQQVNGRREIVDTGNLVAGKFTHMTSREIDPQLHTHVFLFNLTQRADGQWRALHNRSIFRDKMALGRLYRNELANELIKAGYGVEVTDRREGFFRIKGVPEQLEDHFSKRRKQIRSMVNDPEFTSKFPHADKSTLYQIATLGTRAAKKKLSGDEIKAHWQNEIKSQGYSFDTIKSNIEKSRNSNKIEPEKSPETIINQAIQATTETNSVFTKTQILKDAATQSFGQYTLQELNKAFYNSREIKNLGRVDDRNFFTSREMIKLEKSVLKAAKAGRGKRDPLATGQEVADTISAAEEKKGWLYTSGQRAAIIALATARDRVLVIQGDAGTGKTAAMSIFNKLAESKGYTIRGLGFTGKSADELEKGAGIQSQTIDSFLLTKKSASSNEIWLVDESSMAGVRHYAAILDRAQKQDTTVVFVGDKKQFQSIAAGRMFQDLQSAVGTHAELTEVMRQKTPETRAVVSKLNASNPANALNFLDKKGNFKEYKSRNDLQRAAVRHYLNASKQGKSTVVITSNNTERRELNQKIKNELVRTGQIEQGTEHIVLSPHNLPAAQRGLASSYREGQIILIRQSIPNGLKAGQSGKIIGINHDQNTLTVHSGQKQHTLDISRHHSQLSIYNREKINLSRGDRIIFQKNDRKLKIKNGQIGTVKAIDSRGNITVRVGKKTVRLALAERRRKQPGDAKYTYPHIDHAYAITTHKSQGATFDNVIYHAPARAGQDRLIDRRSAYVAATRAKGNFTVLTDNKKELLEAISRDRNKISVSGLMEKLKDIQRKIKITEREAQSHKSKINIGNMGMG